MTLLVPELIVAVCLGRAILLGVHSQLRCPQLVVGLWEWDEGVGWASGGWEYEFQVQVQHASWMLWEGWDDRLTAGLG